MGVSEYGWTLMKLAVGLFTLLVVGFLALLVLGPGIMPSGGSYPVLGVVFGVGLLSYVAGYFLDRSYLKEEYGETLTVPLRTSGFLRYRHQRKELVEH